MVVGATGAITEREQPHKLLQTEKRWRERKRENRQTDRQTVHRGTQTHSCRFAKNKLGSEAKGKCASAKCAH